MNYEEYMNTLSEQISNKRAKELVCKEYADHIADQTESYEAEGLNHEDAELLAVKEMGDPVEAGMALNKIHRPKFPIGMIAVVIVLTVIGICMQGIIFPNINNYDVSHNYIYNTIFYNVIGFGIMLVFLYCDYSILTRHAYLIYIVLYVGGSIYQFLFIRGNYSREISINYYMWTLYPVVFAALLYRNKDRGMRGLIRCIGLTLLVGLIRLFSETIWSAGLIECVVIVTFTMYFAVYKGLFGQKKGRLYMVSSLLLAPFMALGVLSIYWVNHPESCILAEYQRARMEALLYPERYPDGIGYVPGVLRQMATDYSLFGNKMLPLDSMENTRLYSTFILSSIFSWFGIVVGVLVIALLIGFGIRAFMISVKQKNRIGMVLGTACSLSILIRCAVFIGINFGHAIFYTTAIPFLSYGLGGAVINSVMVGIILCVYRNSNILAEKENKKAGPIKKKFIKKAMENLEAELHM